MHVYIYIYIYTYDTTVGICRICGPMGHYYVLLIIVHQCLFVKKRFRGGFDIYLHHQRYYITLMFKDFIYGYIYFLCVGASPKGYNVMHIEY